MSWVGSHTVSSMLFVKCLCTVSELSVYCFYTVRLLSVS